MNLPGYLTGQLEGQLRRIAIAGCATDGILVLPINSYYFCPVRHTGQRTLNVLMTIWERVQPLMTFIKFTFQSTEFFHDHDRPDEITID